jgi:ABC-type transport system involved in cytochrome c biogenesis permease subunit
MIRSLFVTALGAYGLSTLAYLLHLILQKRRLLFAARGVLGVGLVLHAVTLGVGHFLSGRLWSFTSQETLSMFAWLLVLGFFIVGVRLKIQILGCVVPALAFLFGLASLSSGEKTEPLREPLQSAWFPVHLFGAVGGEALFALTALLAVLYLLQERQLKSRRPGFWLHRLPSLQILDRTMDLVLKWGFSLLTIGLLAGGIWAHTALASEWRMDPKQFWAGLTWVLYAVILHLRLYHHFAGRRGAILAALASLLVFFTLLGTNWIYGQSHDFWKG